MSTVVRTREAARAGGLRALPVAARERPRATFAAICALAAAVFLVDLGRSSFFIDEIFSFNASASGFSDIAREVRSAEVAPPAYYYLLHAWIVLTGADTETMLRLPSALAGVAFVGAVAWLGTIIGGRRAGVIAGVLAALSPLTLQYAQEVRSYIFAMLAVALALAAAVRLSQEPERRRWLVLGMASSAAALALNYTSGFVTFPLALWLLFQTNVTLPRRLAFAAATGLPILVFLPLILDQMGAGHHAGTDAYARITGLGLVRLLGTPFDGRPREDVSASLEIGLVVIIDALALLAFADPLRRLPARWLVVFGAVIPVAFVIAYSAFVHPAAISRYTAVAAPLMLVAVGLAVAHSGRVLAFLLGGAALLASVLGLVVSKSAVGQWPDSRGALQAAGDRWRSGDGLIHLEYLGFTNALDYYTDRLLPSSSQGRIFAATSLPAALRTSEVQRMVRERKRLWLVSEPPLGMPDVERRLQAVGYRVKDERSYEGQIDVGLVLAQPRSPG